MEDTSGEIINSKDGTAIWFQINTNNTHQHDKHNAFVCVWCGQVHEDEHSRCQPAVKIKSCPEQRQWDWIQTRARLWLTRTISALLPKSIYCTRNFKKQQLTLKQKRIKNHTILSTQETIYYNEFAPTIITAIETDYCSNDKSQEKS